MLIIKDLTKSSRRQSLQVEKCTSNDPNQWWQLMDVAKSMAKSMSMMAMMAMMAIDGRGRVDVSWPRAIIQLHLLWKNWSNTVNQKRKYLRKSPRQFLVDTTCLKTVLWGNRKYAKGPMTIEVEVYSARHDNIWYLPKKAYFSWRDFAGWKLNLWWKGRSQSQFASTWLIWTHLWCNTSDSAQVASTYNNF